MMLHSLSATDLISKEVIGVVNELIQGKELANQLRNRLSNNSSSPDSKRLLITQILVSYENALSMLNSTGFSAEETKSNFDQNPKTENFKEESTHGTKKRKMSEKVKIRVGTEEESVDDGYFWRKYGQKDILNSKYPRGYYRCTHRFSQECLATKQVQRSDNDPTVLDVTYAGKHTCTSVSSSVVSSPTTSTVSSSSCEKKPRKTEEPLSSFCKIDEKKEIFRTFSFSDIQFYDTGKQENIECLEWNDIPEGFPPNEPNLSNVEDFDLSFLDIVDFDTNFSFDVCL